MCFEFSSRYDVERRGQTEVWFETNVFLLYTMKGINGESFGACLVSWTGACDKRLVRWDGCFITDVHSHGVFREHTTPSTLLVIIMDDVCHIREGLRVHIST